MTIFLELRKAHQVNDFAVMSAYGFGGTDYMKKIQITLFLSVFLFITFIAIINLFKGAMLTVTNCNEKVFTGSKVCCNTDGYYYIENKGSIVSIVS